MDVTSKGSYRVQGKDGKHTDGHYFTLFAEQLTRTFEVLVILAMIDPYSWQSSLVQKLT